MVPFSAKAKTIRRRLPQDGSQGPISFPESVAASLGQAATSLGLTIKGRRPNLPIKQQGTSTKVVSGSSFYFNADLDPDPHQDDANLRPLVYRPFIFEPSRLHCERPRPRFEPLTFLKLDFNVDPDPAFHSNADPDPAFHSNADPNPDPDSKNTEDPDTPPFF
jgi:hypothetical protein